MLKQPKSMEKIQEITECCICMDRFTNPRILPCIHTFCLGCLEKSALQQELKSGDTMQCPVCRKPFTIPEEGMVGIPKNFFMENFMEISKLSEQSSNSILCDKCTKFKVRDANEIPNAVQFCIQCNQNICNRCCQEHERFEELQNHKFVEIGSSLKEELVKKATVQHCEEHNKRELEMFCVDCQQVICMMCFAQKHKFHNCSDIAELAVEFRKEIDADLEKMKGCTSESSTKIQEIVNMQARFQKEIENTQNAIIERGNELKQFIDIQTKFLFDELFVMKQRVLKQIASDKAESETHNIVIEGFERYCLELKSKGSDVEICRSAKDLHLRAEELQEVHKKKIRQRFSSIKISFESSKLEEFLKEDNILGRVQESEEDVGETNIGNISKSDKFETVVSTRFCGNLDILKCSEVWGVTKLENRIYVLCQCPTLIYVFNDQNPFTRQTQIEIKGIWRPDDIGSCEKSKCLYVLESFDCVVWKITSDDHRMTKWLNASKDIAPVLSVSSKGHLMLLILDQRRSLQSLEIYGSDAKHIRSVLIRSDPSHRVCAIEKPDGDIIISQVSQTEMCGRRTINRLSRDEEGVLGRFFPKEKSQDLGKDCYFALDADNDRLFVADPLNNRVILFDSNSLNWIQILLTEAKNGICRPYRVFYDETKKHLIVGQEIGKVNIFEIQ